MVGRIIETPDCVAEGVAFLSALEPRFAHAAGAGRFVLTSSAAAIAYGHGPGKDRFDERDWTVLENSAVPPYHRSKDSTSMAKSPMA